MEKDSIAFLQPSCHLGNVHVRGAKFLQGPLHGPLRFGSVSTGEDVQRHVADFRPGVQGQMRLGDHHDTRDAVGVKPMKRNRPDLDARNLGGAHQDALHRFDFADDVRLAP
ncbi:MAG: hypothetical protein AUH75_10710 [Gemmatimonadetes bacterium 13_1_40CM_4_65_7]|nr:MAG: hypothetical protein AUH75_10710 [Gemmatimonadetes bacterium 13_1_40CM_4_65_7]